MALSVTTIKTTIINEVDIAFGPTDDAATQEKFAEALAQAIFKVLTQQSTVAMAGGGADSNGDTLVVNTGAIS